MNGWEKKWTEGERTVYQKGNRIVNVFHPPGDDGFTFLKQEKISKRNRKKWRLNSESFNVTI